MRFKYQKVQNENLILKSNESIFDNYLCHETDKIVACPARDCAGFVSFSITFNSLSLRTRPNSENNQLSFRMKFTNLFLFSTYTLFPWAILLDSIECLRTQF